jgi:hypothetical protein
MTGAELRATIDSWRVPYSRAAGWLGLSADGLHKQMRGTHAVSRQTKKLVGHLDFSFRMHAITWTEEERQHPDSKAFRAKLRARERKFEREERKFGLS